MRSIVVVLGTRPEAIKLALPIRALRKDPRFDPIVISTGQHREMLDATLETFCIKPDIDLAVMMPRQTLPQTTYRSLCRLEKELKRLRPEALLVHGDTATTLAGGLAGFHHQIPVVHVEAGLRSGFLHSPFPEEGNRRLVAQISALHLAPTAANRLNLIQEGIAEDSIVVTGNTVIDALHWAMGRTDDFGDPALEDLRDDPRRVVVASAHRRDSWPSLPQIAQAFAEIADDPGVRLVVPLHRNPAVRGAMLPWIGRHPSITVVEPLPYLNFCHLLGRADILLSDSSGAQEEGPALGKPTLVISEVTERSEAVEAGTARLVGTSRAGIVEETRRLLDDRDAYRRMATAANPYGDGHATRRTVDALAHYFGDGPPTVPFSPERPAADLAVEMMT
ncbi:non-hydrolyzing UDP-N-acetylglucosamine 2-epimerase [Actinomadura rubrisoli]|uniref:UDP-N-acetylglucosamine 2-epimerase (non-hydrolyzing) n=1 Tax=Actinomadura rubrisoli TaxID=2530368 RepID=A0A4R5BCC2_9ACTN|nr:UDP-N-acetylglucosamine 2-epimerase (non-hydrolyzing) [Actinomadura rubrisoli]TDD83195.1 UDP-N-acetylglucosamine 2-epimerase (non-hydrolyzing) [Actinomadura rubrisoli]